jgi:predicted AAA+ superfamily ATPase
MATPVDEYLHARLSELFWRYLVSGGMPDPVQAFVQTDNITQVRLLQEAIVSQYRYDISKCAGSRARVVRRIFDLMPSEISGQDKRFVVGDIEDDSHFDRYDNDFMWLADANVALPTYNATEPRYPLRANLEPARFKLFSSDVGLLTYQCGIDVVRSLASDRTDINFGAIYENAVAQELACHGFDLAYYKDRKVGELDFVVQTRNRVVPIEVKSGKSYKRHSALTKALAMSNWSIERAVVLHEGNVEVAGAVSYLPEYMVMCLRPGF